MERIHKRGTCILCCNFNIYDDNQNLLVTKGSRRACREYLNNLSIAQKNGISVGQIYVDCTSNGTNYIGWIYYTFDNNYSVSFNENQL